MRPKRHITLTESERDYLSDQNRTSSSHRERMRSQALILNSEGYSIDSLSDLYNVQRETVRSWLNRWELLKINGGISDAPKSGRPSIFKSDEKKKIIEKAKDQGIQRIKHFKSDICDFFKKNCSCSTIKNILKSGNFSWRRLRKSLKNRRNEELFQTSKEEIATLKRKALLGEIELCYLDETGLNLSPNVPYAWQEKGNTVKLPAKRVKGFSVMGILNPIKQTFHGDVYHGAANSDCVIHTLDKFSKSIEKKTILILDNASIHKANIVQDQRERWEKNNLFLKFIPPYSPELNLIEILWKHLKYFWLVPEHYETIHSLENSVIQILKEYGSKYSISFS